MRWRCAVMAAAGFCASFFPCLVRATANQTVSCGPGPSLMHPTCCKWHTVLNDMQRQLFNGGECDMESREALRLMFHDAISYSITGDGIFRGGGADGSILEHADIEAKYAENAGLDELIYHMRSLSEEYSLPYADFLYFAGALGLSNCRGAPRLKFFAGRPSTSQPAPDGMIPAPFQSVDVILARMKDAGFEPHEMVSLLASHSVATQHTTDPTVDGMALDSTPATFDTQFYLETSLKGTRFPGNSSSLGEATSWSPNQFRIQSDYLLARDPRTSCAWKSYILDHERMSRDFVRVMAKVSTLGQDMQTLIDCSEVIPTPEQLRKTQQYARLPPGQTQADIEDSCPQGASS